MTRKDFLMVTAVFAAVVGLNLASFAGTAEGAAFKADDYRALREELAKFYPAKFCRGKCQSESVLASFRAILAELDDWAWTLPVF